MISAVPCPLLPFLRRGFLLAALAWGAFSGPASRAAGAPPGEPSADFPLARAAAWLRPAATARLRAPAGGPFVLTHPAGACRAGDVLGRFDDTVARAAVETAQLRLQLARQQEADFISGQPAQLLEARKQIADLEGKLALARTVAGDPALLAALPAATREQLQADDAATLAAKIEAARAKLARMEAPDYAAQSTARLQVRDAEQTLHEAEQRLAALAVTAPIAGWFQPAPGLDGTTLAAGQEIGSVRDLAHIEAVVPALSPYLLRAPLAGTRLRCAGPGGRTCLATFREAATESSPVTGEARVFIYAFDGAASALLAPIVNTTVDGEVSLPCDPPVRRVGKLAAALAHPGAFAAGWADGVARAWPGWRLACEGEESLGLVPADPARP